MAWVPTVSDDAADGRCAEVFDRIRELPLFQDRVPNVLRSLSMRPEVMGAVWDVLRHVTFGGSGLTREEEELIATVTSSINRCHY